MTVKGHFNDYQGWLDLKREAVLAGVGLAATAVASAGAVIGGVPRSYRHPSPLGPWHDASVTVAVRPAEKSDEAALTRIDRETWGDMLPRASTARDPSSEDRRE